MRVSSLLASLAFGLVSGCASSSRPEAAPKADSAQPLDAALATPPTPPVSSASGSTSTSAASDAGSPPLASADAAAPPAPLPAKVKIVTIGMHVAGGPFDEATKVPFQKAVEPHFPEIAQCWAKHVKSPPKQADVGVDLLIEAAGGHPKVSNPRSTMGKDTKDAKDPDLQGFVPCVIGVFETVDFPKLDRGRTGVSYSLRFTST